MSKNEAPLDALRRYMPEAAGEKIIEYLNKYKVHLTISKERKSVLGDYRHATNFQNHRISVNGNLNKYNFLITLIHELAHLVTFIQYRNKVEPHGKEWKDIYAVMLNDFLSPEIFPPDLIKTLRQSMHNLPASSCADDQLIRALRRYDTNNDNLVLVEQVPEGSIFEAGKDKLFRKGKRLRKRYECTEIETGRKYLFSPVYEVKKYEGV